ncbi:hypothetical protein NGF69_16340 [Enterococcus casseliflavus]|nr:hypothetical protein [Enterococcus casseliflavus]
MQNPKRLIGIDGKPFVHFERGVIYTAKVCRRGVLMEKKSGYSNRNNLSVFDKAVKIYD